MEVLSNRLKFLIENSGFQTQVNFAKHIGVSINAINSYCSGRRNPPLEVLVLICKALDESADYLLGIKD